MMFIAKIMLAILVQLSFLATAVNMCGSNPGLCTQDGTSLMQVQHVLTPAAKDQEQEKREGAAVKKVLIIIAMKGEAENAVKELGLQELSPRSSRLRDSGGTLAALKPMLTTGAHFYDKTEHGFTVSLLFPGEGHYVAAADGEGFSDPAGTDRVGTVPAAVLTTFAIQALKPDLVINAGTAGGFESRGAAIADTFIATSFMNHDRHIPLSPEWETYGIGEIQAFIPANFLDAHKSYKTGVVSTGNSLTASEADLKVMNDHSVVVKEMEAAGIAFVCSLTSTPLIGLKVITDLVDNHNPKEFMDNFAAAQNKLKIAVPELIEYVLDKQIKDL